MLGAYCRLTANPVLPCPALQAACRQNGAPTAALLRLMPCELAATPACCSGCLSAPVLMCMHILLPIWPTHPPIHSPCRLLPRSWLERNYLSGSIPAAWAGLSSLDRLVVRPGNPRLCGPVPAGLPFSVCTDEDPSCLRQQPELQCTEPAAATAGDGGAPQASSDGGGGGVPVAAIAAPVVGGVALLLAAAAVFVAARRRRRRRHDEEVAGKVAELAPEGLPVLGVSGLDGWCCSGLDCRCSTQQRKAPALSSATTTAPHPPAVCPCCRRIRSTPRGLRQR